MNCAQIGARNKTTFHESQRANVNESKEISLSGVFRPPNTLSPVEQFWEEMGVRLACMERDAMRSTRRKAVIFSNIKKSASFRHPFSYPPPSLRRLDGGQNEAAQGQKGKRAKEKRTGGE